MKDSLDNVGPMGLQWNRRDFVRTTLAVGAAGLAGGCTDRDAGEAAAALPEQMGPEAMAAEVEAKLQDNIFTRLLNVQPHLPGHGYGTNVGGCRMPDEVIAGDAGSQRILRANG